MESDKKKRLGVGKVAFLARFDGIRKMVDAGHTMIAVYDEYKKDVPVSYGQFVNYVNKYIKEKKDGNSNRGKEVVTKKAVKRIVAPGSPAFISSDTPRSKDELI